MIEIPMTGRRPLSIDPDEWDVICKVARWDGEFEMQAVDHFEIVVFRHKIEYTILVTGARRTRMQGRSDTFAGWLLRPSPEMIAKGKYPWQRVYFEIKKTCERIGAPTSLYQAALEDQPNELYRARPGRSTLVAVHSHSGGASVAMLAVDADCTDDFSRLTTQQVALLADFDYEPEKGEDVYTACHTTAEVIVIDRAAIHAATRPDEEVGE